jgi:hypothetical protein
MRVLLREVSTGLFYVGFQQWSYETITARNFATIAEAEQHVAREGLRGMDLVLLYEDPRCEVVLPLPTKLA